MNQCPKCHYVRQQIDAQVNTAICPSCGIVYEKWIAKQTATKELPPDATAPLMDSEPRQTFREFILYVPQQIEPAAFWGRIITLIVFIAWGFYFISAGINWEKIGGSFLHGVNLAFHEFGHIFFMPFGHFMMILGGSLFQCLLPLALTGIFVVKQRDNFAGSITLWWCGQNFIDVAPYINDAQYRLLSLVGGGGEESHDWGNLLTMMHALPHTHTLARSCFLTGVLIMSMALIWAGLILRLQKKQLLIH